MKWEELDFFNTPIGKLPSIQYKKANWYGLNIYELEESIRQQECCLISGEGGIGKVTLLSV